MIDIITKKTDAILHHVGLFATGRCEIPELTAVITAVLTDAVDIAQEAGFQEGTANLEDIVAEAVREPSRVLADVAAKKL